MITIGPYTIMSMDNGETWIRHDTWYHGKIVPEQQLADMLSEYLSGLGYHPGPQPAEQPE